MNQVVVISKQELESLIERAVSKALDSSKGPEAWLTVAVVADRLKRSDKTIRNWIRDGRFTRVSGGDGLDLSRFDAAPLIAFTAPKETDYALPGRVMRSMIPRGD